MNTGKQSGSFLIEKPGPPSVLKYHTIALQQPGPGEVLIGQKAIGVNFVDVFFRNGTFPMNAYPAPVGLEAAGVVEHIGSGVTGFAVGDRVAYYFSPGAYAERRVLPASEIFKLPAGISFDQAAAIMIKGLTAHMLLKESHEVKAGEVVLIHAMMGGVGSLLGSWAKALGAIVIGTVGSAEKKALALSRGFDHVVNLQSEDFAEKVKEVTHGKGIDAVYDGTGQATFYKSVELLKSGGTAVLYGWPSGMPEIDEAQLAQRKIRFVRAVLNNFMQDREKTVAALTGVFDHLKKGIFNLQPPTVYPLSDAPAAHADLENRKTTGSIILKP